MLCQFFAMAGPRMQNEHKILVVDGDIHLGKFLKRQLGHKNYRVESKTDGKGAGDELHNNPYDLLTARNRTEDIVRGLDVGADDYLKKPFSFLELAARIQVILSRRLIAPAAVAPAAGSLTIDSDGHQAFRGQRRIDLTRREFEILEYLMNNSGKVLSRKVLMEDIWKTPYDPSTNIVDVYVKYLRDKIAIEGETNLIRTIRGVGYVLSDGCELPPTSVVNAAARSRVAARIGSARAA